MASQVLCAQMGRTTSWPHPLQCTFLQFLERPMGYGREPCGLVYGPSQPKGHDVISTTPDDQAIPDLRRIQLRRNLARRLIRIRCKGFHPIQSRKIMQVEQFSNGMHSIVEGLAMIPHVISLQSELGNALISSAHMQIILCLSN